MFRLQKLTKLFQSPTKYNSISHLKLTQPFSFSQFDQFNQQQNNQYRGKYTPLMPLKFINDRCKIYEYTIYNALSKGYYIILGIGSLILYSFVSKLVDFKERRWYGLIFYTAGTIFLAPKVYQFAKIYSGIIHQIYLSKCGTQVYIKHAKYGIIPTESKFDISEISKPMDPNLAIQIYRFAFPIGINNQLFFLPRDTEFQNQEVLPPIMNGIYINTEEYNNFTDEIIIE